MELADLSRPGEKKKLIWAGILGLAAIILLWWTFFGFGSSSAPSRPTAQVQQQQPGFRAQAGKQPEGPTPELSALVGTLHEVIMPGDAAAVPEARRNIFAFYEPPTSGKEATTPTPTPTPTPPVLLASLSPGNVYARTADFNLDISGDKFTSDLKIFIDGQELPTRYRSAQQLSATVPATAIANPGARQVSVRSADGRFYSNSVALNVSPPPTPNYNYVGLFGTQHYVDTALLQDLQTKAILNVQRGDVLSGRFRVTSIADKELVLVDTNLKIKHTLKMTEGEKGFSPMSRPTPRVDAEDDEPDL
jgi:TIG domain-containing protein